VASAYANEKADYISPGEIKGVEFFHDHVTDDAEVHSLMPRIWGSRNVELNYWRPLLLESVCSTGGNTTRSDEKEHYFLLGERDVDSRIFLGGELEVEIGLKSFGSYNLADLGHYHVSTTLSITRRT